MPVQFVIGRAGSGKTHRCFTSIVDAMRAKPLGKPIYWIVPKQATFMAERMLTVEMGAFCRTRVVSFELLAREIFAYAGGNVIPEVTAIGRQMVIGHLLRELQPQLGYFASSARQPGLAAELDATFAEFERSGKTTDELKTLINEIEISKPVDVDTLSLLAKLQDLHLVYNEYANFLGQDRLDQHQRLRQVLACVDGCPPIRGATVYVDGFAEFTDFERRLLAGLAKVCERVEIMLLIDPTSPVLRDPNVLPADDSLFHQIEETYRRLWFTFAQENASVSEMITLEGARRFANSPALAHLETWKQSASDETQGIELVMAPDRAEEVDAAARRIRALTRDGVRFREIAVLMRDIEPYHAAIDASFREHGIAYFVDRRRSAAHHPLLQFIRSFFQIIRFDWPNESAIALMKTGLAGVTNEEADEVEHYVADHYLRGRAWEREEPWKYRKRAASDDEPVVDEQPEAVDVLRRRIAELIRPSINVLRLNDALTVKQIAAELFAMLDRFKVPETLTAWANAIGKDDPEQAAEHAQTWAELVGLCEQMVDLLGDKVVALEDFVNVLESGLEQFDLAITPQTVDQVLVGAVDRTRCPELKAVLVLGLNEGDFPRVARDPSILTEPERRELRRRQVELDSDRRRQLGDEELLGYIAFTRASQRLIVSRTQADDKDRPANPSRFWEQLRATFPDVRVYEIPCETPADPRCIETPRQVLAALMQWARKTAERSDIHADSPWPTIYQWLATSTREGDTIRKLRDLAWPAVGYTNDAKLSADLAAELFGTPLKATARQLETFAACPFQHFAGYGLGLSSRRKPGVSGLDLSQVYHRVLENVLAEVIASRTGSETEDIDHATLRRHARSVGQTIRGELRLSTGRNKYLLARVERTLSEVVAAQTEMARRGQFRPSFARVEFSDESSTPPLRFTSPTGHETTLHGTIDRIDTLPDGSHATAFDYKLSSGALSMQEVYYGLSLQLLTYLLVLQANGEQLAGRPLTPVAAFYLPLMRRLGDVDHPDEALDPADPKFNLRVKPRGVFNAEFFPGFDSQLANGPSDVIAAYIKKDGEFGLRDKSDVADPAEFAALLAFVHRRLGELADGVVSGRVDVMPYRLGTVTPCPRCDFRSVCRFEPSINRYNTLQPMRREETLAKMTEGSTGD